MKLLIDFGRIGNSAGDFHSEYLAIALTRLRAYDVADELVVDDPVHVGPVRGIGHHGLDAVAVAGASAVVQR